jgi:hypothetical protein
MYGMNVHDAAFRLLQNPPPKRSKKAGDGSAGLDLDGLRAYILDDSKEMRECWSALNDLHKRTSEVPIDCEYVATLEATNAYVAYLAGIGILTEKFATKFAEAVELNKRAAMTMTAEARQTKLSPGDTEEIYLIEPEDRPSKGARRASYGDFFVSAKDSGADVYDDGELTPKTESASTGARLPVYDDFPDAYDDLEELGDWVTAGDEWDTLLSWDRIRSFGRFINGTHTNRAIVAAGTGIMLMGADFINPYVRAALFGGATWALARSARRATAQAEDNDLAEWAAGLGAGGVAAFAVALQQALTPPPAGPLGTWQRLRERLVGAVDGDVVGARLFSALADRIPGLQTIRDSAFLVETIRAIVGARHYLAAGTALGFLTYFCAFHHSCRYVPSRQRYYLHVNRLDIFQKYIDDMKACLDRIKTKIAMYPPMPDVLAPNGRMVRPSHDAQRVWNTDKRNHAQQANQLKDDLDDIYARRRNVNDDAATNDELERACVTVNRYMDDMRAMERQIQRLAATVRAKLLTFNPPIPLPRAICPQTHPRLNASVVEEVFAKLAL